MIEKFSKATKGYSTYSPRTAKKKFIHLLLISDKVVIPKHLKKEIEEIVKEMWEKNHKKPVARIIYK